MRRLGHRASCAAIGLAVEEDDAGAAVGSDAGNLLARDPGAGARRRRSRVLLCAHLDTVPPAAPVDPGARRRRLGERQRRHPRSRQQGRGGGDGRARRGG